MKFSSFKDTSSLAQFQFITNCDVHVYPLTIPVGWVGNSTDAEDSEKSLHENLFIATAHSIIHPHKLKNILMCSTQAVLKHGRSNS